MQTSQLAFGYTCRNCLGTTAEYDAIHSAWHKAINTLLNDYGDVELQNSAVPFNIVLVKFFVVYRK